MRDSTVWMMAIVGGSALLLALVALGVYGALAPGRSLVGLCVNGLLAMCAALLGTYSALESRALPYVVGYALAAIVFAGLAVASLRESRSDLSPPS